MVSIRDLKIGQNAEILKFDDSDIKFNSARLGLIEGGIIRCIAKPGPVVIEKNNQVIAIGKNLSKQIYVSVCN
jgi:hypothetical protein